MEQQKIKSNRLKKRKIPILKLSSNIRGTAILRNSPAVKDLVLNEAVTAIKDGILRNKKSISLFGIANSNLVLDLKKEKWKSTLQNSMDYFAELEDYDKCIEIRDLISKL